ncbi:MAG: YcjX family protein [Planctomycetia bacterium]|nr:YcjX family protein [Planctomycetia bacterium]
MLENFWNNPVVRDWSGRNRSIGVLGFGMSGKTVLLTSLRNHLRSHNPDQFDLEGQRICELKDVTGPESGIWKSFPYEENRFRMAHDREWPSRTVDCSCQRLQFRMKNRRNQKSWMHYRLTLYDIPGERTPDVCFYENDYAQWSDWILEDLARFVSQQRQPQETVFVQSFLQQANTPSANATVEGLVRSYKLALIEICSAGKLDLVPSLFLLDEKGVRLSEKITRLSQTETNENVCEILPKQCSCGCPGKEFVPLGPAWREHYVRLGGASYLPDLSRISQFFTRMDTKDAILQAFVQGYEKYRREYVVPLFGTLINCDSLAVLIDIPSILQNGPHQLNATRNMVENTLKGLRPGDGTLRWLLTMGFQRKIERIAFVATQCDRFYHGDWETLRRMTEKLADDICNRMEGNVEHRSFYCAAVQSTDSSDDGTIRFQRKTGGTQTVPVWKIPPQWHGNFPTENDQLWCDFRENNAPAGEFRACKTSPSFPKDESTPPRQVGLDQIFRFLTQW